MRSLMVPLVLGAGAVSVNAYAQDDAASGDLQRDRDPIDVIGSMYRYRNDTYSEADIRFVLESFPPAAELLQQSKRQRTIGTVATALGGALFLGGTITSFTRDCYLIGDYYICSSNAPVGVPIALSGLGIGLGIGMRSLLRGADATERAVGIWNTDH